MNCNEIADLLQRRVDNQLSEAELEICDNHLHICPDCVDRLEALNRISEQLNNLPKVTPRFSLVDAIMPELERIDIERNLGNTHTQANKIVAMQDVSESESSSVDQSSGETDEQVNTLLVPKRNNNFWRHWRPYSGVAAAAVVCIIFIVAYTTGNNRGLHENVVPLTAANTQMEAGQGESTSSAMDSIMSDENSITDMQSRVMTQSFDSNGAKEDVQGKKQNSEERSKPEPEPEPSTAPASRAESGLDSKQPTIPNSLPKHQAVDQNGGSSTKMDATPPTDEAIPEKHTFDKPVQDERDPIVAPPRKADEAVVSNGVEEQLRQSTEAESSMKHQEWRTMTSIVSTTSPNNQFVAVLLDHTIVIEDADSQEVIFQSEQKKGSIQQLQWDDESKWLTYETKLDNGAVTKFQVDVAQRTEKKLESNKK
ncbi:anti-sigma factor family protein [Paenibacillus yanchengensis]|uniref:Anti-sigma factor family protein n=1 Tax=Paenibacillus yanchengensis TaxID=2035833 RepID=A0ABW4YKA2_9BACL